MDRRWRPDRFTPYVLSAAAAATLAAVAATGVVVADGGSGGDGNAMAARAAAVMPFDLAATTHTFTPTADGGVQKVVAVRAGDSANISQRRTPTTTGPVWAWATEPTGGART